MEAPYPLSFGELARAMGKLRQSDEPESAGAAVEDTSVSKTLRPQHIDHVEMPKLKFPLPSVRGAILPDV